MKSGEEASLSVAHYLRPEGQVVPFWARPELDELLRWSTSQGHARIRLVTGKGGVGKTRLALRLCEELAADGWQPLWVRRGSERKAVADAREMRRRCLLVVDYAETRGELAGLLDDVASDKDGPELRVVLLARSAGEWWQRLLVTAEEPTAALLEASAAVGLGPVSPTGGTQQVFDHAVTAFAQKLGVDRPDARLTLSDPDPVVLVVHAAALLAVVDDAAAAESRQQAISGSEVLKALLRHEERYWARTAASRGLELDLSVLRVAVMAGCMIGAESETAAGALLARIPDLELAERRGQVARWLHDLYPADDIDLQERDWLGSLRPDRLAEELVVSELATHPELIPSLFSGLDEARAARALTVLARAALTHNRAIGLLGTALVADLDQLAVPALSVAVETNPAIGNLVRDALTSTAPSASALERIANALPYPSFALGEVAVLVLGYLIKDKDSDAGQHAEWLGELGNWLSDLRRPEEAFAATDEAVTIYRQLAKDRPDAFLPKLAATLNNLSHLLSRLRREEEALAAIEEAVTIYRQLAQSQPDTHLANLATSLDTESGHLWGLERKEEALAASEEAVTIYSRLAQSEDGANLSNFAAAVNNQASYLFGLEREEEALAAIDVALILYRWAAEARPDANLLNFAVALNHQSGHLSALGRKEEALAAIDETVTIYRQLAESRPDQILPNLARSLDKKADCLFQLERREEALAAMDEAVTIYRQLAQDRPDEAPPDLAKSLFRQADYLSGLERDEEALAAIDETVTIYRQLAENRPDQIPSNLARSLDKKADCLFQLERWEEALAAMEETVTIYRQLAQDRLDETLPDLAKSLFRLADCLFQLERWEEALAAMDETVTIYRQLAQDRPDETLPDLAKSLFRLADCLSRLGREEEALEALVAATEEALIAFRRAAVDSPDQFLPSVVMSLNNLADLLDLTGRESEAAAARAEAIELSSET